MCSLLALVFCFVTIGSPLATSFETPIHSVLPVETAALLSLILGTDCFKVFPVLISFLCFLLFVVRRWRQRFFSSRGSP